MSIVRVVLILLLAFATVSSAAAEETGYCRLKGELTYKDGRPLAQGMVYLYDRAVGPPPLIERYWRVPDQVSELDEDGQFDLELSPGTYYITYLKRADRHNAGPPRKGDVILLNLDSEGQPVAYSLKAGEMRDTGKLAGAVPFNPAMVRTQGKDITAIAGRIVGEDDKPIAGAAVFAFMTPAAIERPLFVSELSDGDGRFLLRVSQGGTYYLKVRGKHGGGQPSQDSVLDGERDEKLIEISVASGETAKGVIHKVLTLRGPESKRNTLKDRQKKVPADEKSRLRDNRVPLSR